MRIIAVIIILSLMLAINALAQKDPAAQEYLDRVAEEAMQNKPLQFDFTYHLESVEDEDLNITQEGTAILKGDKYRIEMPSTHIFFDGKFLYNYIPEVDEITISLPEEEYDEFFLNKPSKIFTLYKEDFKYRLTNKFTEHGRNMVEIDLHPHELERSYFRIRLHIDADDNEIVRVTIFEKMGNRYTLTLSNYKHLNDYPDSKFTFNPEESPETTVMDLREL